MSRVLISFGLTVVSSITIVKQAMAQTVVPDGTVGTTVTRLGNTFTIETGTTKGTNLFHSFQEFSIPTSGSAIFNNDTAIQNIFSRVTGSSLSTLDGTLQANGSANLFLLNPNGIVFGPNARLNIGGSFIGTTAQSIRFSDGTEFSALDSTTPLLTLSVPIGLQMGLTANPIRVSGSGHNLTTAAGVRAPLPQSQSPGLTVSTGNTLALVAGNVDIAGGILSAPGGVIEIGAVKPTETIGLLFSPSSLTALDYSKVSNFGNVSVSQQGLVSTSGTSAGTIRVNAANVTLTDGSVLAIQNRGTQPAGAIAINATETVELLGNFGRLGSGFVNETISKGQAGDVTIAADRLRLGQGAAIGSKTFGDGPGGNINITAKSEIAIQGYTPNGLIANISALTGAKGDAGNINVQTPNLQLRDGGGLFSFTRADGKSGNIMLKAQTIDVRGKSPTGDLSSISTSSLGSGNGGEIEIKTDSLRISQGASVSASSFSGANAGTVTIEASREIVVEGVNGSSISQIRSAVQSFTPIQRRALGLPGNPPIQGNAGGVAIKTRALTVQDGARVSVRNDGSGRAGTLVINADAIQLRDRASLTAQSALGGEGNIAVVAKQLLLRNESRITATAGGTGNGGDINLQAPIILGLQNSDIIANAEKGRGGSVEITTQGIIGLQYRDQLTLNNDITASSEFGINGTVQVNAIGVDPNAGLVSLPSSLVDPSDQIAANCSTDQGSRFIATGRGGLAENPIQDVHRIERTWQDLRPLSDSRPAIAVESAPLVEATKWERDSKGKIQLIAEQPGARLAQSATAKQTHAATCTPN